ncbi:MAG: ribonuclease P [Euryarchaeota archaeon]|nr:ribonuclease P [Euryarchaeota archaeon]
MRNKRAIRRRARKSISRLFNEAEKVFDEHPKRANRYTRIARSISLRCRVKVPKKWKKWYCKNCHRFLKPGANVRIRLRNKKIVITCLECGDIRRFPYKN